jgi:hypothetical protein
MPVEEFKWCHMLDDKLTLIYDEPFRLAVLQLASAPSQQGSLLLRAGFSVEFLREAILATGWVRADGEHFRLTSQVRIEFLCDVLADMLQLFDTPDEPSRELRDIEMAVAAYQREVGSAIAIPLLALAWLDAIVREDLADEARSAVHVWSAEHLAVECEAHRQRRMKELVQRYSATEGIATRLAPSSATRNREGHAKLG